MAERDRSLGGGALLLRVEVGRGVVDVPVDPARPDVVDGDPVVAPLAGEYLGEQPRCVLGGTVNTEWGERHHRVHGRGDHDPAALAVLPHVRGGRATTVENTVQVHVHDRVPVLARDVGEPLPAGHTGIRHEDIEPAEPLDDFGDEPLVLLRAREVCLHEAGADAEVLELRDAPSALLLAGEVVHRHVRAPLGERDTDPAPDPTLAGGVRSESGSTQPGSRGRAESTRRSRRRFSTWLSR